MKKYKLIKEYPGSIKLGEILEVDEHAGYITVSIFCLKDGVRTAIPKSFVLQYPEYWQEVIEKDYEILSFKSTNGNCFCGIDIVVLDKNGNYSWNHPIAMNFSTIGLEKFINNPDWSIHSAKRLSDGKIFTIGDKVKYSNENSFIINYFTAFDKDKSQIVAGNLIANHPDEAEWSVISKINHCKQPLFTTEDGVEIFEGDEYYFTNNVEFNLEKPYSKIRNKKAAITDIEAEKNYPNTWKNFSTKKAAEEYIIMNNPCLSLNDIENTWSTMTGDTNVFRNTFRNVLKNTIKSKLKL